MVSNMHIHIKLYNLNMLHLLACFTGENGCTMNVHLPRHLPECVRNWGPLWAYSCFPFESMNGHLKTHFHGTRCMNAQVRLNIILYIMFFTVYSHVFFHLAGFFICYASSITEECHGTLQNQHVRAHLHNIHNLSEQLKSQIML